MRIFSISFAAILLALTSSCQDIAEAKDPRLVTIISEIKAAEARSMVELNERIVKYTADLKALEENFKALGDIDSARKITNERMAWEGGKRTPSMNPKDQSIALDLRKLRYYLDQDLAKIKAIVQNKSIKGNAAIAARLDALTQTLTAEGKHSGAAETEKVKKDFVLQNLDTFYRSSLQGTSWISTDTRIHLKTFDLTPPNNVSVRMASGGTYRGTYLINRDILTIRYPGNKKHIWKITSEGLTGSNGNLEYRQVK